MAPDREYMFSPFTKQCFVTAGVGFSIIGHGCVLGYASILLPQLWQKDALFQVTDAGASWIASIVGIIQIIGSFVSPPIMEKFGRKITHLAVIIPALIGWVVTALAVNFEMVLFARILLGLSIGMMSPLRSVIIGEYTSPKNRGAFLTIVSLSQTFGIMLVHLIGSIASWQLTALICVAFPFVSLVMTIFSPETPSWLVSKGRHEDCREIFKWLRGEEENAELEELISARILFEKAKISAKYERKTNKFQTYMKTIQRPEFYKPIILMMHAHVLINFSGGATMASYSTVVIEYVMGPEANVYFWMIFLDIQRFFFNTLAVFAINKLKRRTMMFATGALSVFSQIALSGYLYLKQNDSLPFDSYVIPVVLINLKILAVAVGMLPVPNVIGGEVFPLQYRGIGSTISVVSYAGTLFIVLKSFSYMVEAITMSGVYLVYGIAIAYCMGVIYALLPETKGKTLQQIEDEYRGRPLTHEEIEARKSLKDDPVEAYKRRLSQHSEHSVQILA